MQSAVGAPAANADVVVEAATPECVPKLAHIVTCCYRSSFSSILEPEALAARDIAFFERHFTERLSRLKVAKVNGEVVGFSLVTDAYLDMLFVQPGDSGKGVGTVLLDSATRTGLRSIECFRDNQPARQFYERRGWIVERAYQREFLGKLRDFVRYVSSANAS